MNNHSQTRSVRIRQLFFSAMIHRLYDYALYRFVSPVIWACPTECILDSYMDNISTNHLEIGVGTGYWLERCLVPELPSKLALMDINSHCLKKSAQRLAQFTPTTYQRNITEPLDLDHRTFDSIALNFVLHCVAGSFADKQHLFGELKAHLNPGGVLFGATLLSHGVPRSKASRVFMRWLNRLQIFDNSNDRLDEFREAIKAHFTEVDVRVVGSAVLFRAVS